MIKNNNKQIDQALSLMNSEVKDVFVDDLQLSIERAIEKAQGKAHAHIESAVNLSQSEKKKTENVLLEILQRKVDFHFSVKPSLIGGFRITVGDWKLDATLAHQLESMKNKIGGSL